ncbi:MAG: S41 family peptidase [Bacteroidia bacterium]|nr:S41 family peptidase [Bacteroidia bacterium]
MKPILLLLAGMLSLANFSYSQSKEELSFMEPLCQTWGFLKYYHPRVAQGKIDWDSVLVSDLEKLDSLPSRQDIQDLMDHWIAAAGPTGLSIQRPAPSQDSLLRNLDLDFLNDSKWLTIGLKQQLLNVINHRIQSEPYYAFHQNPFGGPPDFRNEKTYINMVYPSMPYRMLALFRYWNAIQYFYPYKYLIDKDWNDVLTAYVPQFYGAADAKAYHDAGRFLTAEILDSHSNYSSQIWSEAFGNYRLPFRLRFIDGKVVISELIQHNEIPQSPFTVGDIILEINGKAIDSLQKELEPHCIASNTPTTIRNIMSYLTFVTTEKIEMVVEGSSGIKRAQVASTPNSSFYSYYKEYYNREEVAHWRMMDDNIGYVDMGRLEQGEARKMMKELKETQAIIFDVRNYPKGTLYEVCRLLLPNEEPFVKFTYPDPLYPGTLKWYPEVYKVGKRKNSNPYLGKVFILQDESTQSHAEFTVMALQTFPNSVTVGSQTAGADGNVTSITMPGGIRAAFTGLGVYYPDGRETQRIGIIPDFEIKPSLEGIREGKDEVLEYAVDLILNPKP